MKTITIQIADETAEAIDNAINSQHLRKYPKEQAYSLFIDALVSEVRNLPRCCCNYVPEHQHPPAWCFR
jgi:hypothetical protein